MHIQIGAAKDAIRCNFWILINRVAKSVKSDSLQPFYKFYIYLQ